MLALSSTVVNSQKPDGVRATRNPSGLQVASAFLPDYADQAVVHMRYIETVKLENRWIWATELLLLSDALISANAVNSQPARYIGEERQTQRST